MPFPPGFLWGAATAATRSRVPSARTAEVRSIWDRSATRRATPRAARPATSPTTTTIGARADVDLMAELGLNAYRFSVAWPRLLPGRRRPDQPAGLAFYDRLVDRLMERGIRPMATLYHWDLPQALQATRRLGRPRHGGPLHRLRRRGLRCAGRPGRPVGHRQRAAGGRLHRLTTRVVTHPGVRDLTTAAPGGPPPAPRRTPARSPRSGRAVGQARSGSASTSIPSIPASDRTRTSARPSCSMVTSIAGSSTRSSAGPTRSTSSSTTSAHGADLECHRARRSRGDRAPDRLPGRQLRTSGTSGQPPPTDGLGWDTERAPAGATDVVQHRLGGYA